MGMNDQQRKWALIAGGVAFGVTAMAIGAVLLRRRAQAQVTAGTPLTLRDKEAVLRMEGEGGVAHAAAPQ